MVSSRVAPGAMGRHADTGTVPGLPSPVVLAG
jgi:hypothetical protein